MDHGTDRGHRRGCRPDVSHCTGHRRDGRDRRRVRPTAGYAGHDLVLVARNARAAEQHCARIGVCSRHRLRRHRRGPRHGRGDGCCRTPAPRRESARRLARQQRRVRLPTSFLKSAVDDEEAMLRVFVLAVLRLSHAALPGMVARGRGAVVNVSSVAGFLPGGTYSAAKAWVTVFSEGLHTQLSGHRRPGHGPVLRLRPHRNARADGRPKPGPSWVWLDAQDVVAVALRDLRRDKAVSVPGLQWKALVTLVDLLPRAALRRPASLRRR